MNELPQQALQRRLQILHRQIQPIASELHQKMLSMQNTSNEIVICRENNRLRSLILLLTSQVMAIQKNLYFAFQQFPSARSNYIDFSYLTKYIGSHLISNNNSLLLKEDYHPLLLFTTTITILFETIVKKFLLLYEQTLLHKEEEEPNSLFRHWKATLLSFMSSISGWNLGILERIINQSMLPSGKSQQFDDNSSRIILEQLFIIIVSISSIWTLPVISRFMDSHTEHYNSLVSENISSIILSFVILLAVPLVLRWLYKTLLNNNAIIGLVSSRTDSDLPKSGSSTLNESTSKEEERVSVLQQTEAIVLYTSYIVTSYYIKNRYLTNWTKQNLDPRFIANFAHVHGMGQALHGILRIMNGNMPKMQKPFVVLQKSFAPTLVIAALTLLLLHKSQRQQQSTKQEKVVHVTPRVLLHSAILLLYYAAEGWLGVLLGEHSFKLTNFQQQFIIICSIILRLF